MDQILAFAEMAVGRLDWISAGISGLCALVVGGFATMFARGFELEGARYKIVWFVIFAVSIWPVRIGAKTYVSPPLYEWQYEDRIVQELMQLPLYATLLEHHPEAKQKLVRASVKSLVGGRESIVGEIELGAIVMHYVATYFPKTSDHAAKQFVWAATAIVDQMLQREPEACIGLLLGDRRAMAGNLPEHVFRRYADALAAVINDAIADPQPIPDRAEIAWKRQRVAQRMTSDGNPLITDPQRLMGDPNRACFALLAVFNAVSNVVVEDEIGAFLRGTIPEFLKDDEA